MHGWRGLLTRRFHHGCGKSDATFLIDSDFGHNAERWAVDAQASSVGTAIGLSLQATALMSGTAKASARATTSLFAHGYGGIGGYSYRRDDLFA